MRSAIYIDTSALCKLIIEENESTALRRWIEEDDPLLASSELVTVELARAVRARDAEQAHLVQDVLDIVTLIPMVRGVLRSAGTLHPPTVKSLDAIHLATALILSESVSNIVTYDKRMADAAHSSGFKVISPGVDT